MLPIDAVLNHLLATQPEARARLARHAGRTLRVDAPPFSVRLAVREDGLVAGVAEDHVPDVRVTVDPARLPQWIADRAAALKSVRIEGDAEFARTIGALAEELRWDAEEDLSRVVGDVAAYRAMGALRGLADWARDAAGRLTGTTAAYLADEMPVLVRGADARDFGAAVATLRDDCARLEKRLEHLEAARRETGRSGAG